MSQVCNSYGVNVENVQNLTKGFCLFYLSNLVHAQKVLSKGSCTIHNSLLVLQHYMVELNVENEGVVDVPLWVEFLILPLPLWNFLHTLADTIGHFVYFELEHFFLARPS